MSGKTKDAKRANSDVPDATESNRKSSKDGESRSVTLAKVEIRTTRDYGRLMAALITDVIQENISPTILNAAVNAGRQMIKAAELNLKYGRKPKQLPVNIDEPCLDLLTGQTA